MLPILSLSKSVLVWMINYLFLYFDLPAQALSPTSHSATSWPLCSSLSLDSPSSYSLLGMPGVSVPPLGSPSLPWGPQPSPGVPVPPLGSPALPWGPCPSPGRCPALRGLEGASGIGDWTQCRRCLDLLSASPQSRHRTRTILWPALS